MKVRVISLPYIFHVLYVLCFTRPRYQVRVYRTIGPLVKARIALRFLALEKCLYYQSYMSLVMRKPAFCICENKEADQLRGNREADQRLCFRYTESTIYFLNLKFQGSSHLLWLYSPVCVRPGRKPGRQVFFHNEAHILPYLEDFMTLSGYVNNSWLLYIITNAARFMTMFYCGY